MKKKVVWVQARMLALVLWLSVSNGMGYISSKKLCLPRLSLKLASVRKLSKGG